MLLPCHTRGSLPALCRPVPAPTIRGEGQFLSWRFGGESSLLSPCHSPLACWRSAGTDFPPGQKSSGGLGPCPSSGRQVAGSDPHFAFAGPWPWRTIHAILGSVPLLLRVL